MKKREPNNHIFILCLTGFSSVNLLAEVETSHHTDLQYLDQERGNQCGMVQPKGEMDKLQLGNKNNKNSTVLSLQNIIHHSEVTHLTKREEKNRT